MLANRIRASLSKLSRNSLQNRMLQSSMVRKSNFLISMNARYFGLLSQNQGPVFLSYDHKDITQEIDTHTHDKDKGTMCIKFPFIADPTKNEVGIEETATFEQLSEKVMERDPEITQIEYQDPAGNFLVTGEKLRDWKNFPVIMNVVVQDEFEELTRQYALNLNTGFQIDQDAQISDSNFADVKAMLKEENYLNYCEGVGMTKGQQYFLANYASKIHSCVEKPGSDGKFSHKDVYLTMDSLKHYYATSWQINPGNREEIEAELNEKSHRLIELMKTQSKIMEKAIFRSKLFGLSLAGFVVMEFLICAVGTYETYSWDVIEPVSYMMGWFNFVAGFGWYCRWLKEPEKQVPTFWYQDRVMRKMQRKSGYTNEELQNLMKEIKTLQDQLKQFQ